MERNLVRSNIIAGEDLSDGQFLCVGVDGKKTGATGDAVYGIVRVGAAQGQPLEVVTGGEYWVKVGEAVVAGDYLTGGAEGKAMKARFSVDFDNSEAVMDRAFCIALEAGDADAVVRVLIR